MRPTDCADVHASAAEFALEVLPGDERARIIQHLDGCGPCRELVSSLTNAADMLLECSPEIEPPSGFDDRVMAKLTAAQDRPRHQGVRNAVAATAFTVATMLLAILGPLGDAPARPVFASAEMRTDTGEIVGHAAVQSEGQGPPALHVSAPEWLDRLDRYGRAPKSYSVLVEHEDGTDELLPAVFDDDATWSTTLDTAADTVAAISIIDDTGRVWCSADFATSR